MAQVGIAWILSKEGTYRHRPLIYRPDVTQGVTAPIIGTTSLKNLHDIIGMFCFSSDRYIEAVLQVRSTSN
jgi:aryl-alcohol dehydrogenase-like predicted oxidoreductase